MAVTGQMQWHDLRRQGDHDIVSIPNLLFRRSHKRLTRSSRRSAGMASRGDAYVAAPESPNHSCSDSQIRTRH
jgi:hypothetical protein